LAIYRKNGYWWVSYLRADGSKARRCTYETKRRNAQAYARRLALQSSRPEDIPSIFEMSLGAAVNRYVEILLLSKGKHPNRRVRRSSRNEILRIRKIEDYFGSLAPLNDLLQPHLVGEFSFALLHQMKPSSANRYLSVLRALLNRAYEWGSLSTRPVIHLNKDNTPPFRSLSPQEESKLIECCAHSIRDYVIFLLDTGARKSEALELTWNNVQFDRQPRPAVLLTETKGGRPRLVPIPLRLSKILEERRHAIPLAQQLVFCERARQNIQSRTVGVLFAKKGDWIPLSGLTKRWNEARAKAGVPGCRLHDLRHTYASKLVKNGVPLLQVAKLLGHSSVDLTMRYAHLAVHDLDDHVGLLDYPIDGRYRPFNWKSKAAKARHDVEIARLGQESAKRGAPVPTGARTAGNKKLTADGSKIAR